MQATCSEPLLIHFSERNGTFNFLLPYRCIYCKTPAWKREIFRFWYRIYAVKDGRLHLSFPA